MGVRTNAGFLLTVLLVAAFTIALLNLRSQPNPASYSRNPGSQKQPLVRPTGGNPPVNKTPDRAAGAPAGILPLTGKTVVVDAGHGGIDPGAVREGVEEADITLAVALELEQVLEQRGAKVVLTRSDDTTLELAEIVAITENACPDVFVSIHVNCAPYSKAAQGIETYFRTDQSRLLAHTVHAVLVKSVSVPDRRVHTCHFYVVQGATPAILVETGYITNKEEREKLCNAAYQRQLAEGLADGLARYWAKKGFLRSIPSKASARVRHTFWEVIGREMETLGKYFERFSEPGIKPKQ